MIIIIMLANIISFENQPTLLHTAFSVILPVGYCILTSLSGIKITKGITQNVFCILSHIAGYANHTFSC